MNNDPVEIDYKKAYTEITVMVIEVSIRSCILELDRIEGAKKIRKDLQQCRKALLALVGFEDDWGRTDE